MAYLGVTHRHLGGTLGAAVEGRQLGGLLHGGLRGLPALGDQHRVGAQGRAPTEKAMEEAAVLAARHSKAKDSAQVPVDYTQVRNVSKPQGAKPGKVIYVNYKTMFVDPA